MPLVQDDHVIQQVSSATSDPTLRNSILQGLLDYLRAKVGKLDIAIQVFRRSVGHGQSRGV